MTSPKHNANPKAKLPSNFKVLSFSVPCPACGATAQFASAGSVMAVCDYCQTTIVKEGDEVKAQGKQSLTIEDYSPLQLGSVGSFQQQDFVVIGRIQLKYNDGIWNEWYLQLANGKNAWLSEALGQYSLTVNKGEQPDLPSYDNLAVNQSLTFAGVTYRVTDKRSAVAIAGEGELPFVVGAGWQTWVIDARFKRQFITLDYAEQGQQGTPIVYQGGSVTLKQLNMQLLKDEEQINQATSAAGLASNNQTSDTTAEHIDSKDKNNPVNPTSSTTPNRLTQLDCPNCGSPVPFVAGSTNFLLCPTCHSEIKLTGSTAEVLKLHSMMQHYQTSLTLGAKARILATELADVNEVANLTQPPPTTPNNNNTALKQTNISHDYVVIGIMRLEEVGEYATWTEYLLYSFTDGFLWLAEESSGWFIARVLNELPVKQQGSLIYNERIWQQKHIGNYQSKVIFAIGAFNWRVNINDTMILTDYFNGSQLITSEQNHEEITYTLATKINKTTLERWFADQLKLSPPASTFYDEDDDYDDVNKKFGGFMQALIGLVFAYFFLFLGSLAPFIVSVVIAIVAFVTFAVLTSNQHGYTSVTDITKTVVAENSMFSIMGGWAFVLLAIIINLFAFGTADNHSSGSGFYYSSGGREGYSSSGSHK